MIKFWDMLWCLILVILKLDLFSFKLKLCVFIIWFILFMILVREELNFLDFFMLAKRLNLNLIVNDDFFEVLFFVFFGLFNDIFL